MDPQGAATMNNGGGVYNYDEIWPGFHANATSYRLGLDPMLTDQRSNRSPPNHRKRREDDDELCAKGGASTSSSNGGASYSNKNQVLNGKRLKAVGSTKNKVDKKEVKSAEQPKQDYIHVRARRGQATDSHSLAERARREKIGERMKILQDIVPGCNKVIGKALVLDEIINYVQSLQRQVEFLSMKLEAVNARDRYPSKDFAQQSFEAPGIVFGSSQSTREEYSRGSPPEWLHMQIGGGFKRTQ